MENTLVRDKNILRMDECYFVWIENLVIGMEDTLIGNNLDRTCGK